LYITSPFFDSETQGVKKKTGPSRSEDSEEVVVFLGDDKPIVIKPSEQKKTQQQKSRQQSQQKGNQKDKNASEKDPAPSADTGLPLFFLLESLNSIQ
jgi:hypothetical protein